MAAFFDELLGRDPHTKKMKALAEIERCRRSLSSILSIAIIDESFNERRRALERNLDALCAELKTEITYSNWWADWETAIRKQRELKSGS
jgi:hypothetical protein